MPGRYRYTFTGPARLTDADEELVRVVVAGLLAPAEFTTGACSGWDMAVARAAVEFWPEAHHRIVLPAAPFADLEVARLCAAFPELELVQAPDAREPYRAQNEVLCQHGDVLVAGVRGPKVYRSGEWMTIRIARRLGIPVEFHVTPAVAS